MPTDDGGPAFPVVHAIVPQPGQWCTTPPAHSGMSLRDWFAGQAISGTALVLDGTALVLTSEEDANTVASTAYRIADAMLKARSEHAD